MRLHNLFADAPADVEITGLAYDNRSVTSGDLFFCVPGFTSDGHRFAADAVSSGAVALVVDHPLLDLKDTPQVVVPDVRASMATAAAVFFRTPTTTLQLAGITGTNGKTTSAYLLRGLLEADARPTGLLGTVKSVIGGVEQSVTRTTPEAIDLQQSFRRMLDAGDLAAVMEVSSHALELGRVARTRFAVAVFTNLTQDHLDFHASMEAYFGAKRRLFTELAPAASVINIDDRYGARLAADPAVVEPITFGISTPEAEYRATDVATGLDGTRFTLITPTGQTEVRSPLRGLFNVYNMLGAIAAAEALEVPRETIVAQLAVAGQIPGRFETVDEGQPFAVVVDYAHTPDSLENVLNAARELASGALHVVFGCGGDRDRGKRPLMGAIAARLADHVVVTSDNPRSERPDAIIDEILVASGPEVRREVDRRAAIELALGSATAGDVVVIAGKGHEQGQEFEGGRKVPFDDVTVVREVLSAGWRLGTAVDSDPA